MEGFYLLKYCEVCLVVDVEEQALRVDVLYILLEDAVAFIFSVRHTDMAEWLLRKSAGHVEELWAWLHPVILALHWCLG